jgi:hypothetical protein
MKNLLAFILLSVILSSCIVLPNRGQKSLDSLQYPDFGPAPELTNQVWINTEQPLRLADLRGQVVLLEMWTFG